MKLQWIALAAAALSLSSCMKDDDAGKPSHRSVQLNLQNLEDPGSDFRYEAWIVVNGEPKSIGTFTASQAGAPSHEYLRAKRAELNVATAFFVTVEPVQDTDPAPGKIKVLAGDFAGDAAELSTSHALALGSDLSPASGTYRLATPTTAQTNDEQRGVWLVNQQNGTYTAGLQNLPALGQDWKYESWMIINGKAVSMGKFRLAATADEAQLYSGTTGSPLPFPGEDFIEGAPAGLIFPNSLSGNKVLISVEPHPDNSPEPFMLKAMTADIPATAQPGTSYTLSNQAGAKFPQGTATR